MSTLTLVATALLVVAAVIVVVAGGLRTGAWRASSELALRFVLGAGMLALTGRPGWWLTLVVGVLVAIDALTHWRAVVAAIRADRRRPAGSNPS